MFSKPEAHFAGDYFFKDQALGTATDAQISEVFQLGNTEGGIRVHGWIEGSAASASGETITAKLQVGDLESSTAATDWKDIETNVITADGTAVTGDIISVIPDTEKKFMRVSVEHSTGVTAGNFTVAVEYVPR